MESEELRLLRENNMLLKLLIQYIVKSNNPNILSDNDVKDFLMNCLANKITNNNIF